MAEMALERGLLIDSSCIWRWVQVYGPELDRRCRPHLKRTNNSYRVDETYIRIKGQDRYLYRAVDSTGQTINVDKNRAYPAAVEELKVEGTLRHRCRLRQYPLASQARFFETR
jgi:transposase-like protein